MVFTLKNRVITPLGAIFKMKNNFIKKAVRTALLASATAALTIPAAYAADEEGAEEDRVVVTGSRIRRTDVEGATPVVVITREDIKLSGQESISDVIRNTTYNSFGSFRERSGSSFGQIALVNLRGLGADRTAVLINGRRAVGSPYTGTSAVNLNAIPLAAVESIEILTDSASAVYGADAIGGVINIIMRKEYEGAEFDIGTSRPSREGANSEGGSVTVGASSGKGNIIFSAEAYNKDAIFDKDRSYSKVNSEGITDFNDLNLRGVSVGGNSGFDLGFSEAFPIGDCPEEVYVGVLTNPFGVPGSGCGYGYGDISAQTGSIKRFGTFLNANYNLNDDTTLYFENYFNRNETFGRYAPAVGFFFVSADSPANPRPGENIFAFHRFVGHGPRDDNNTEYSFDTSLGITGIVGNDIEYDAYVRRAQNEGLELGSTYILQTNLEDLVASGDYDLLNPLSNSATHRAAVLASSATISRDLATTDKSMGVTFNGSLGDYFGAGYIGWAAGAEYADNNYQDVYDSFREAGNVIGSAGNSSQGRRHRKAVFAEALVPLASGLEANVALRTDSYSDFGNEFSPQVAFRYQPIDSLLFRASWGEGFKAPSLTNLYSLAAQSFNNIADFTQCRDQGIADADCATYQVENFSGGNPGLAAETSESINFGAVWSPTSDISLGFDIYNIDIEDYVTQISIQTLINLEADGLALPPGTSIVRGTPPAGLSVGRAVRIDTGFANVSQLEVKGIDFKASYKIPDTSFGTLSWDMEWSHFQEYNFTSLPGEEADNLVDDNGLPENNATLTSRWNMNDHTVNVVTQYIDGYSAGEDSAGNDTRFSSFVIHNVAYSYASPWDMDVTVGLRNIFDRDIPINPNNGGANQTLYFLDGRVPFINLTKRF